MKLQTAGAHLSIAVLPALAALVMNACSLAGVLSDEAGRLVVSIRMPAARTIVPSLDMTPASYAVSGTGPGGRTFSVTTTATSVSRSSLKPGAWVVSVFAVNPSGTVIGQGSGNATVSGSGSVSLAVTVAPLSGNGTLALSVTWNAAVVPSASVVGLLQAPGGLSIPLGFTMGTGTAESSTSGIPAGYYTLSLQLLGNGLGIMGAVDVARISAGQTTTGAYDFIQAASAAGSLSASLATVDTTPLVVALTGQGPVLATGASMTVSASVEGADSTVTYTWYLDGSPMNADPATSSSLTLGEALAAGVHRLDVVARTGDGSRAGAATYTFTIQ